MRKAILVAVVSCVVASMLFFLAPAFRQAFQVSLARWHSVLPAGSPDREPGLEALARRAEQKQDAEALVFVAVRDWDASEGARLAQEAERPRMHPNPAPRRKPAPQRPVSVRLASPKLPDRAHDPATPREGRNATAREKPGTLAETREPGKIAWMPRHKKRRRQV